jgi:hypothetical protein
VRARAVSIQPASGLLAQLAPQERVAAANSLGVNVILSALRGVTAAGQQQQPAGRDERRSALKRYQVSWTCGPLKQFSVLSVKSAPKTVSS